MKNKVIKRISPTIQEDGTTTYEHAYDRCLGCEHLGAGCDGPNTLSMSLSRWCEWCHDLKVLKGLTNADVAELSGVSQTTVDRVMAGQVPKDIMRSTCADITRVLIGSWGQWPCSLAAEPVDNPSTLKELEEKRAELYELRRSLDKMRESHIEEIRMIREEAQRKVDFLRGECEKKDKLIAKLAGL